MDHFAEHPLGIPDTTRSPCRSSPSASLFLYRSGRMLLFSLTFFLARHRSTTRLLCPSRSARLLPLSCLAPPCCPLLYLLDHPYVVNSEDTAGQGWIFCPIHHHRLASSTLRAALLYLLPDGEETLVEKPPFNTGSRGPLVSVLLKVRY
jgi:hypothetical protein